MYANFFKNWIFSRVIAAAMMSAIYDENKDDDDFLYMSYRGENTFGHSEG